MATKKSLKNISLRGSHITGIRTKLEDIATLMNRSKKLGSSALEAFVYQRKALYLLNPPTTPSIVHASGPVEGRGEMSEKS